ncbi:MAG: hypothetical protein ACM36C_15870, partial [Acidobacteriota bacterium]
RLARDTWLLRLPEYRAYLRNIAEGLQLLSGLRRAVDDIRELAGPPRAVLRHAQLDAEEAALAFSRVTPPADLAPVHALFVSAVQLASSACKQRLAAVSSGSEQDAWSASSAAAGSLMLLDRARQDLTRWLKPPSLPSLLPGAPVLCGPAGSARFSRQCSTLLLPARTSPTCDRDASSSPPERRPRSCAAPSKTRA